MLKALAVIAAILVVAAAVVLVLAMSKPDIFRVERSATIKAPPDKIFPMIADFHRWGQWSPYETRDPGMKRTFSGTNSGKGSVYGWEGNSNVGSGRMEILDAPAPRAVVIKLDFLKPFEAHNTAEFTLQPQGDGTRVTWAMQGPTPFIGKIMHVFINMDRMVGTDFEAGLANLRKATES
ncbi:MAG: SRPBCC family protein [Proteobacteria bacterium]|nr:SRPBCC family protein [Pseudomonadota bacterium]